MRDWRLYLVDMRGFASRALRYRQGLGWEVVFTDPMRLNAILLNLELLKRATKLAAEKVRQEVFRPPAYFPSV